MFANNFRTDYNNNDKIKEIYNGKTKVKQKSKLPSCSSHDKNNA